MHSYGSLFNTSLKNLFSMANLESLINQACLWLDGEPENNPFSYKKSMQTPQREHKWESEPGIFLLWGSRANHITTKDLNPASRMIN